MILKRFEKNPILAPNKNHSWEARAVLNACPIKEEDRTYLLYRALSLPQYHTGANTEVMISSIGITESTDGKNFSKNSRRRFIYSYHEWERFGCEDPRVTKFGDKYYIFYTALSKFPFCAEGIRVGLAISSNLETIEQKYLITPFNAKAMTMFPERINGKIWSLLTVNPDKPPASICLASFDEVEEMWSEKYWKNWYKNYHKNELDLKRSTDDHIEIGAPPIKTKKGWLLIYSHIQNYFSDKRLFGIEAVLLDLKDPTKVIAKTEYPIMVPEEYYEECGLVDNIVFPSGAFVDHDMIYLYYGSADTTCSLAFISLSELLEKLVQEKDDLTFKRGPSNPILACDPEHPWEAKAVFNPAAIYLDNKVHILYRAMSEDNTSVIGYASSRDGFTIDYRHPEPIYVPREPFEQKANPGGNSGCEDARIILLEDKIYMFYTGFDGRNPPRVALTSISKEDFINQEWRWEKPILISPPGIDDKNSAVFPEKIGGKYAIIHRIGKDINISFHKQMDFKAKDEWLEGYRWISPRKGSWDSLKIGISAPPIKTKDGWLLLYHGVSEKDRHYRIGALLLDLKSPLKIIARTEDPLIEPETYHERVGQVPNVVFPCGAVVIKDDIYIYYGEADQTVGVATINMKKLLKLLNKNKL